MDNGFSNLREFGKFRLDVDKKVLWWDGAPVQLPPKEAELLTVLTDSAGQVVTKTELMDRLWADSFVEESNLSRHIYRLRKVFEEHGELPGLIETVPRRGYRFTGAVSEADADVVIERHSLTRTTVETVHDSIEPVKKLVQAAPQRTRFRTAAFAATIVAVVTLAGFGIYRYFAGASAEAAEIRSIAVLPFRAANPDSTASYRGFAIADLLISKLANIKELKVRPTSTVVQFVGAEPDLAAVRDKLNVDGVIEGTFYEDRDGLTVTARLVRTRDRVTVWARDFKVTDKTEGSAHGDIALRIADALAIDLSGRERTRIEKRFSSLPDAMRMYQEARYHWSKRDNAGLAEAHRLFRNAAEADPNFALAYVGIADSGLFAPQLGDTEFALEKALSLDPDLGEAFATRGFIRMFHKWDWNGAEEDLRRAIDLNPGYATAHQWYATLLMIRSRPKEAAAMLERAIDLDPISANLYSDLAQARYYSGDLVQAEASARRALEIAPDFVNVHGYLSDILFMQERYEEAFHEQGIFGRGLSKQPLQPAETEPFPEPSHVRAFRKDGLQGYWKQRVSHIESINDSNANRLIALAQAQMNLGDTTSAIYNLEQAIKQRAFLAPFLNADPAWHPIRADSRFRELMSRMQL